MGRRERRRLPWVIMFVSGAVVAHPLPFYQQLKPFPRHVVVHQVPRFRPYDVSRTPCHGGLVVKIPSSSSPRFVPPAEGTESCGWCGPLRRDLSQTAVVFFSPFSVPAEGGKQAGQTG
ncbi:hypothetical protein RB213_006477 [Colletotrichum asianum]